MNLLLSKHAAVFPSRVNIFEALLSVQRTSSYN